MSSLLSLLTVSSPQTKNLVIKILSNIASIRIPHEVFEEATRIITNNDTSVASKIMKTQTVTKFKDSQFL